VLVVSKNSEEREKAEKVLMELSPGVRYAYRNATTYHDGKWLAVVVDNNEVLDDIEWLLTIKRRPKRA